MKRYLITLKDSGERFETYVHDVKELVDTLENSKFFMVTPTLFLRTDRIDEVTFLGDEVKIGPEIRPAPETTRTTVNPDDRRLSNKPRNFKPRNT